MKGFTLSAALERAVANAKPKSKKEPAPRASKEELDAAVREFHAKPSADSFRAALDLSRDYEPPEE